MRRKLDLSNELSQQLIEIKKRLNHIVLNDSVMKQLYGAGCSEQCRTTCAHYCHESANCETVCIFAFD
jgi:hypothetical protein